MKLLTIDSKGQQSSRFYFANKQEIEYFYLYFVQNKLLGFDTFIIVLCDVRNVGLMS